MTRPIGRRDFLRTAAARHRRRDDRLAAASTAAEDKKPKLKKAVKYGMVAVKGTHPTSSNSPRSAGSSASRSTAPAPATSTNS